jgi:hypothetical protein
MADMSPIVLPGQGPQQPLVAAAAPEAPAPRRRKRGNKIPASIEVTDDDLEYDEKEFVPAKLDHGGATQKEFVRITPLMARNIEVIVQDLRSPFDTKSDFLRWAIVRALAWWHKTNYDARKTQYGLLRGVNVLAAETQALQNAENTLEQLSETITRNISEGDVDDARNLAYKVQEILEPYPDCGFKRRFVAKFHARYGYLLKSPEPTVLPGAVSPYRPEPEPIPAPAPAPAPAPDLTPTPLTPIIITPLEEPD